jgi:rare lipoprotein A
MTQKFLFLLLTSLSVLTISGQEKKTQQKEKTKDKITKITDVKENKETVEHIKVASSTKVDTTKIKVKNIIQEIDSTNHALLDANFILLKKKAHASYYHQKFHGRRTASGKKFDNNAYTAAHKKLPFGTKVKVTNEVNGKFVIVEITDRGPFSKAREIDLTRRAFMDIADNKKSGVIFVTLEVVEEK